MHSAATGTAVTTFWACEQWLSAAGRRCLAPAAVYDTHADEVLCAAHDPGDTPYGMEFVVYIPADLPVHVPARPTVEIEEG